MRYELDFNGGTRANPKREITDAEKKYLLENYSTYTIAEMATYLGVSYSKAQSWVKELGIEKKPLSPWRKREVNNDRNGFFEWDKNLATI